MGMDGPMRQDMVWDLPLPWTPQMKVDQGILVLRKRRRSGLKEGDGCAGKAVPRRAYWGSMACQVGFSRRVEEKMVAFEMSLAEALGVSSKSSGLSELRRQSCSPREGVSLSGSGELWELSWSFDGWASVPFWRLSTKAFSSVGCELMLTRTIIIAYL